MPRKSGTAVAQAWVESIADDPEAVSALAVAQSRLVAGKRLIGLRRFRLIELSGALPSSSMLEDLLHRSIQFYNPHKERCTVRVGSTTSVPLAEEEQAVLVLERGGSRRSAAERWWLHEVGRPAEVREAAVWALRVAKGVNARECTAELATLRNLRHGLLANLYWQEARLADRPVPLPWITVGASDPNRKTES